ncbi:MAG: hypothetical protein B6I26_08450 [Desulfobacteraceae bacterium 4572_130]|nr:MAG: hypothetical protein B6I26_08450 [Desulfobacteraceae bacterium 4572_130]
MARFLLKMNKKILIVWLLILFSLLSYRNFAQAGIIIEKGETLKLSIDETLVVNGIEIKENSTFINSATSKIHVHGDWINNGNFEHDNFTSEIRVDGDWINNGNFEHGNSTVYFTGDEQTTIQGSNNFYALVVDHQDGAEIGKSLVFESGGYWAIGHKLILKGTSGTSHYIKIRSSDDSTSYNAFNIPPDKSDVTIDVKYVDVKDAHAIGQNLNAQWSLGSEYTVNWFLDKEGNLFPRDDAINVKPDTIFVIAYKNKIIPNPEGEKKYFYLYDSDGNELIEKIDVNDASKVKIDNIDKNTSSDDETFTGTAVFNIKESLKAANKILVSGESYYIVLDEGAFQFKDAEEDKLSKAITGPSDLEELETADWNFTIGIDDNKDGISPSKEDNVIPLDAFSSNKVREDMGNHTLINIRAYIDSANPELGYSIIEGEESCNSTSECKGTYAYITNSIDVISNDGRLEHYIDIDNPSNGIPDLLWNPDQNTIEKVNMKFHYEIINNETKNITDAIGQEKGSPNAVELSSSRPLLQGETFDSGHKFKLWGFSGGEYQEVTREITAGIHSTNSETDKEEYTWQITPLDYIKSLDAGDNFLVLRGSISEPLAVKIPADIIITKTVNRKEASVGNIITYTITAINKSDDIRKCDIIDDIPEGFKYINNSARFNGDKINPDLINSNDGLYFFIGDIETGDVNKKTLRYQLIIGTGVNYGSYPNSAVAIDADLNLTSLPKSSNGQLVGISNTATAKVKVVPNPLFDLSTVIGKVFHDNNGNGRQDLDEKPIPHAKLFTSSGQVITVDENGQYHLANVVSGRMVIRIDKKSLPVGSKIIGRHSQIINIRPGIPVKANFAVKLPENIQDLEIPKMLIEQLSRKPKACLNASQFGRARFDLNGNGLVEPVEFRMYSNYLAFIKNWKLEIKEDFSNRIVKTFEGDRLSFFNPIYWNGEMDITLGLSKNKNYIWQVTVIDEHGREATTHEIPLKLKIKSWKNDESDNKNDPLEDHGIWLKKLSQNNIIQNSSIRIKGKGLKITTHDVQSLQIIRNEKIIFEIPVYDTAPTASDLLRDRSTYDRKDGDITEIILPRGKVFIKAIDHKIIGLQKSKHNINLEYQLSDINILDKNKNRILELFKICFKNVADFLVRPVYGAVLEDGMVDFQSGKKIEKNNSMVFSTHSEAIELKEIPELERNNSIISVLSSVPDTKTIFESKKEKVKKDNYISEITYPNPDKKVVINKKINLQSDSMLNQMIDLNSDKTIKTNNIPLMLDGMIPGSQATLIKKGKSNKTTSLSVEMQEINVGEISKTDGNSFFNDDFILVGIIDGEIGYRSISGNIDIATSGDSKFKENIWKDGKIQLYFKGTVKGEYFITGNVDTERNTNDLFRNLDPHKSYSVYGDNSSVTNFASKTNGKLYLLIEKDESWAEWGQIQTAINDTQLAQFERSLQGAMIHYESLNETSKGKPVTTVDAFKALALEKTTHNEFVATGNSLYYLKHQDVIRDSLRLKLEVRDSVNNNIISSEELIIDKDFEFDSDAGKITFWNPPKQYINNGLLISSTTDKGNLVHIIANYNYTVIDDWSKGVAGGRIKQTINDNITLGATYANEDQDNTHYVLKSIDTALQVSKNHEMKIEYAETKSRAMQNYVSQDGGLNWAEGDSASLNNNENLEGKAASIYGKASMLNNQINLDYYYRYIENDFSSSTTTNQAGYHAGGVNIMYHINEPLIMRFKHDTQRQIDDDDPNNQSKTKKIDSTVLQGSYMMDNSLTVTGELRHQNTTSIDSTNQTETNHQTDHIAMQADYKYNDKIEVTLAHQQAIKNDDEKENNGQTSLGVFYHANENLIMDGHATYSKDDLSGGVNASYQFDNKLSLTTGVEKDSSGMISSQLGGNYKRNNDQSYNLALQDNRGKSSDNYQAIAFGSNHKIGENGTLTSNTAISFSGNNKQNSTSNTYTRTLEKGQAIHIGFSRYENKKETENTNGYNVDLGYDLNKNWAINLTGGNGYVYHTDGEQDKRSNINFGASYTASDKDGKNQIKSVLLYGYRRDRGQNNLDQHLINFDIKGKVNKDWTLFSEFDWGRTKNLDTSMIETRNNRFNLGFAYRPVLRDNLNLIGKYSWFDNQQPENQTSITGIEQNKGHVLAADILIDLSEKWQVGSKLALQLGKEKIEYMDWAESRTWLAAASIGYAINRDTRLTIEIRRLDNKQSNDNKDGIILELSRRFNDNIEAAVGYNWAGYNDDLADLDYTVRGIYLRVTGVLE